MERLTFKQFLLKEAKGYFGQYGETDARTAALIASNRLPDSDAASRERQTHFWAGEGDPQNRTQKDRTNLSTNYTDTIQSLKAQGKAPRTRNYRELVNRNSRIGVAGVRSVPNPSELYEAIKLSSGKITSPKLRVFDFDNTIANTSSSVIIKDKKTGKSRKVTSAEFARYKPAKHEETDFSEFSRVINPQAIVQIQGIMSNLARKKRPYTVLTARPQSSSREIIRYLKKQGLHTKGVRVIGLGTSDPQAKARYLGDLLRRGKHSHLEFFDDHKENVHHVAKLRKEFPSINIKARHIAYGEAQ
jgi:hypothetical protein